MCQCSPTIEADIPEARQSVHAKGREEAERHKWIESEKAGRDLGESAIRNWVRDHWNGFLRDRWLEHLQGRHFWIELDQDDYGLLQRAFRGSALIDDIIHHLRDRRENLDVVVWALDHRLPMEEVLEILTSLDVNSRRIEYQLESRMTPAS